MIDYKLAKYAATLILFFLCSTVSIPFIPERPGYRVATTGTWDSRAVRPSLPFRMSVAEELDRSRSPLQRSSFSSTPESESEGGEEKEVPPPAELQTEENPQEEGEAEEEESESDSEEETGSNKIVERLKKLAAPFKSKKPDPIRNKIKRSIPLRENELALLYDAKAVWIELNKVAEGKVNLFNSKVRKKIEGMKQVFTLAYLQSKQIDGYLIRRIVERHHQKLNEMVVEPKQVVIQGGGMHGLMAAFKIYFNGARPTVLNGSDPLGSRMEIVRLDPVWNGELNLYLGASFQQLKDEGYASLDSLGRLEVSSRELEAALSVRFIELETAALSFPKEVTVLDQVVVHSIEGPSRESARFRALITSSTGSEEIPFDLLFFAEPFSALLEIDPSQVGWNPERSFTLEGDRSGPGKRTALLEDPLTKAVLAIGGSTLASTPLDERGMTGARHATDSLVNAVIRWQKGEEVEPIRDDLDQQLLQVIRYISK